MPRENRIFRLFVSSTFSDLKAERNALQEHVFPRLKHLCQLADCRFQDIDLRWGVSEEAGLDQRTMRICLQEIARCQEATPRPNFVVLLGDRYGWCPLPFEIPADDFAVIAAAAANDDLRLLEWYRRDDNAVSTVYRLLPRERGTPYEDYDTWTTEVERPLHALLARGTASLAPERRARYSASATEHEIRAGALVPGAKQHVFGFFRTIAQLPNAGAGEFRDLDPAGAPDTVAAARLQQLKERLEKWLGPNVEHYSSTWLGDSGSSGSINRDCVVVLDRLTELLFERRGLDRNLDDREWAEIEEHKVALLGGRPSGEPVASPITLTHIPALCADLYLRIGRMILHQIAQLATHDALEGEKAAHRDFGRSRSVNFIGRRDVLDTMRGYLGGPERRPLVVAGDSGSGKTALLAHAAAQVPLWQPDAEVVVRFVGATPESADGRSLLLGVCREVARRYDADEARIPEDYRDLARQFPDRLAMASERRPLTIFLDALDMLSASDRANALGWLPRTLPPNVYLIATTTAGEGQTAVERRLGPERIVPLDTLSLHEGARLLRLWLAGAQRRLTRAQRRVVLEGFSRTRLPLYLKLAFEAAREWTSDEQAGPLAIDVPGLVAGLFARLSDEGNHGERMVSRSLAYMAAARHGLTEDEILDVLSRDETVMQAFRERSPKSPPANRLPVVVWSRLFHDLQSYLARQRADGTTVLTFYHQQVRRCAHAKFLADADGTARHAHLAKYYEDDARLAVDGPAGQQAYNLRKLAEQPYQQALAERWKELAATLGNLDFLQAKVDAGEGYDAMADFDRASQRLPKVARYADDPHELTRAIVREFGSAFGQESDAFLAWPESTAQQVYNNVFAHSGFEGPTGDTLRRFPGPASGRATWLRRVNLTPRTAVPRTLVRTIAAHDGPVSALASSPDGQWIASGGHDGMIRILQRSDGSETASLSIGGAVAGVAWAGGVAERLRLVSADQAGTLTVWDWEGERAEQTGGDAGARIRALIALSDGRLATGTDDYTVGVWEPGAGRASRVFRHQDRVLCVAADQQCRLLISGGADRTVRLWALGDGAQPAVLRGHQRSVRSVAADPRGVWAASGDEAGVIRIWDLEQKRERRVVAGHRHWVTGLGILPKAGQILSGSADTTIKVWDAVTGQALRTLRGHTRAVTCLAVDPQENWFASGGEDGTVRIWQAESELAGVKESFEHEAPITALTVLPTGEIASASEDETVRLWNREGGHQTTLRGHVAPVTCLLGGRAWLLSGSADRTLRAWRLDGSRKVQTLGQPLTSPPVSGGAVTSLAWADSDRVLSAGEDGIVRLWDPDSGRQIEQYEPAGGTLGALVALDEWVVGGGSAREVMVWRKSDGRVARKLAGHESSVTCLAPAGLDLIVSGSLDATLRTWSLATGKMRVLTGHLDRVNCVAVDRTAGIIASGSDDGKVLVWKIDEESPPTVLSAHSAPVRVVAAAGNGRVASGGDDGRIAVWDLVSGRLEVTGSVGSAVSALSIASPAQIWVGTRGASVTLLQLETAEGRH